MNRTTELEVKALMECTDHPCITLILGTKGAPFERVVVEARFKQQVRDLKDALRDLKFPPLTIEVLLAKLETLIMDQELWLNLKQSLVVYLSENTLKAFTLESELKDTIHIAERFSVKYLLPHLFEDLRFHVLFIRNHEVRLFSARDGELNEHREVALPQDMRDVTEHAGLKYRQQGHSSGSKTGKTNQGGYYSGAGEDTDGHEEDVVRFFKAVDRGVTEMLKGSEDPLVLVGVESEMVNYRSISRYPNILPAVLSGVYAQDDLNGLYKDARKLIESHVRVDKVKAIDFVAENEQKKATLVSLKLDKIREAADAANVDTLLLWPDETIESGLDDDVVESVARQVYRTKGKIYAWFQTAAIQRHS